MTADREPIVLDGVLGLILDRAATSLTEIDDDALDPVEELACCGHWREQHNGDADAGSLGCDSCTCAVQP